MRLGGLRAAEVAVWLTFAAAMPSPVKAAQASAPVTSQAPPLEGLENSWDVRKIITDVQKDTAQLQPILSQINPQTWVNNKGAPTTYLVQWQSAQQQCNDLATVTKLFAQKTESLSQGLDTYFRLEALEVTERSLAQGVQQYDTRAQSDKLNMMIAHNFANRERLRNYLHDLATSTEQNFKIADEEAQRCRANISRIPLPSGKGKSKKN